MKKCYDLASYYDEDVPRPPHPDAEPVHMTSVIFDETVITMILWVWVE